MNKLYSVHDHWTDINKKNDVDIESIDGVITGIKVNGEDYGGGGGGSSEMFKIATVNIINNSNAGWGLSGGITNSTKGSGFLVLTDDSYYEISTNEGVPRKSTKELQAILMPQEGKMGAMYTIVGNGTPTVAVTGNAKYSYEDEIGTVYITGDCTITIS